MPVAPGSWIARTQRAFGRFLFLALALVGACHGPPPISPAAVHPRFPDPVLRRGPIAPSREVRAADLARRAEEALAAGNAEEALRLAREVVEDYPEAPVSGLALLTFAMAALETGAWETADAGAERFARLLVEGDPRSAEARLLQAEAQARRGDQAARLERLLRIGPQATPELAQRAASGAREAAAELGAGEIERALARTPLGAPARPVALARYASLLEDEGRSDEALRAARAALDAGARGVDSLNALAVIEGPGAAGALAAGGGRRGPPLRLAAVLPLGGSPGLGQFAREIAEGVEVAAATALPERVVTLETRDSRGDPSLSGVLTVEIEAAGVLGAVGFLEETSLRAAAARRAGELPLVSPTARVANGVGVYTLSGADPAAAAAVARYAARHGFERVAVIHSRSPASTEEADAFAEALAAEGVPLVAREAYDPAATFFRDQIAAALEAVRGPEMRSAAERMALDTLYRPEFEPVALFVPIPPEDVELLAPQITFYGLDTLAVRILGTSGWTDPQTLQIVDNRHTNGVVAVAPAAAGPGSEGYERFRDAYEEHFRRTLASSVPALGYDAALLLLGAAQGGARTSAALRSALERVRDLQGATGVFSVLDGRVLRRMQIVLIEHGNLIPTS